RPTHGESDDRRRLRPLPLRPRHARRRGPGDRRRGGVSISLRRRARAEPYDRGLTSGRVTMHLAPLPPAAGIRMELRASEGITVAYFAYLAGAAVVVRGIDRRRRRRAIGAAAAVVIAVLTVAWLGTSAVLLRDWMPLVYILLGYWLPALLVTSTNQAFERRLLTLDQRWLGIENVSTIGERAPRRVIELLELAYLFCYPMVPVGYACLYVAGLREESDRFWTAVLAAVFGCY